MNKMLYPLTLICFFILNTAISQTISISGKVVRHNGDPVEGVTVTCTNAVPVTSADDGSFTFTDLPEGGNFLINGMYATSVFEGVTILDVLFGANMISVPGFDFTMFQSLASDFNRSGSFSAIDLVEMRKTSVKINGGIPATYWYFFDQTGIPQGGIFLVNVTEDVVDLELVATKLGDVAIDSDHFPPPPNAPQPEYYITDISAVQNEELTVEIRVNDYKNIGGFQHDLIWDPAVLEFIEIEENDLFYPVVNEDFLDEGHFLISGGIDNLNVDDGTVLYAVKFKALQEFTSLSGLIEISETMIPRQTVYRAENDDLFLVDESFVIGESVSTTGIASLEKFDISPNPAHDEVFVKINFENAENAELSLYDVSGRLMNSWKLKGNTFEETIGIYNLPAGTYVLKLRTQQGVVTKKLMKH